MISVVFTCNRRPELTELCLRRFIELMPQPYELFICYDGSDPAYIKMLQEAAPTSSIIFNSFKNSRFSLINDALDLAQGTLYMHVESDFYWVDPLCLDSAIYSLDKYPDVDFIRFEYLPFTERDVERITTAIDRDLLWMKRDASYRFNFNPHIRRFKYPNGKPFMDAGFTKQPEQHHNEGYERTSCLLTGDNWRHLGVWDEGGHEKPYYAERFFGKRGMRGATVDEYLNEFDKLTPEVLYRKLFREYVKKHERRENQPEII